MFRNKKDGRKDDRINLRFSDRNFMDDMRILARSEGLTLTQWVKRCLRLAVYSSLENEILNRQAAESAIFSRKFLEQKYAGEDVSQARQQVEIHIKNVKKHVRGK